MKKLGKFIGELNRIKKEVLQIKDDVENIVNEVKIEEDVFTFEKRKKKRSNQKPKKR